MRKKGSLASLLLVLALLFAASTSCWAETVVTLAMRGGQNYVKGVNAALEVFYKLYPDIKVDVIPSFGRDKFRTSVAAGAPPDIYAEGAQYIISHAASGMLMPLDKYIAAEKLQMQNFVPPNVELGRWQGNTYAIPLDSDINFAFFRNTELLQQAGVDPNKPVQTIRELDDISRKMYRVDGDGQLKVAPFMPWQAEVKGNGLLTMGLAFGGSFWDTKTSSFTTAHPRNVEALEWMVDYARRYHELGVWQQTTATLPRLLGENKLVFGLVYSARALGLRTAYPDLSFKLGPIPHVPGQGNENPVFVAGTELIMPVGAKNPEAAFKLMAFLSSHPEGNSLFAHNANLFPSNLRSPYHREMQGDPIASAFYQQAAVARFSRPPVPNADTWTSLLNTAVDKAITLQVPANQALMEADQQIRIHYEETMARLKK